MDFESSISDHLSREPSASEAFEFVLLSRNLRCKASYQPRRPKLPVMYPLGTPIWDDSAFLVDAEIEDLNARRFASGPWKMLIVMLIK
ncbi:hypothetical protein J1614_010293 [Plenodomus biglobosus]|nr:hypothetical protein J1614_010293 [Plenodomus biglobosus]